ncbi:hypothetical protein CSAL01_09572 [Colletotrichum salicis]|uniref:Uncharacterized protein n=1 Tax=Colletotrichum salicis TaxID=1209931 RepID=A0A135V1K3_9PEZI|nr:hypothetical protein CSAL01_09572 [Colletotrichum salicis]
MAQPSSMPSQLGELHILPAIYKYTDPAYFNHDDILLNERNPMRISTFMSWHIANWTEQGLYGRDLWLSFQREFDGWDTDLFNAASTRPLGILRDFLLYRGVYTPRDRSRVAPNLVAVLEDEDFHPWTSEEVEEIRAKAKDFNDRIEQQPGFLADITRGYISPAERQRMDDEARAAKAQTDREINEMVARQLAANHAANRSLHNLNIPQSRHTSRQSTISKPSTPRPSPHNSPPYPSIPSPSPRRPPLPVTQQPNLFTNQKRGYLFPPPSPIIDHRQHEDNLPRSRDRQATPTTQPSSRQLSDLSKLVTDDMKYSGEMYDVFDVKMNLFRDNCSKVGIEKHQLAPAFSIMLRGKASIFYANRLCGRGIRDFETMVDNVKGYFENEEKLQSYLSEWRETTFDRITQKHPDKSKTQVLDDLIEKLALIQRALPISYHSDEVLRTQLLNACSGIKEWTQQPIRQ